MKGRKRLLTVLLAAALVPAMGVAAESGEETFPMGFHVGVKGGVNSSNLDGEHATESETARSLGLEAGYDWRIGESGRVGVEGFFENNGSACRDYKKSSNAHCYGTNVVGAGVKLGLDAGRFLPYAKLGVAQVMGSDDADGHDATGFRAGVGMEYLFHPQASVGVEWSYTKAKDESTDLVNRNLLLGLNYYPGAKKPEPKPEPIVQPAVQEASPVVQALMQNKPVTLQGTVFDFDSARLRPSSFQVLDEVVKFARDFPKAKLDISGHTDNIGSDAYNQRLSEARAEAVKRYLESKGVEPDRIMAKGYSFHKPIASNASAAGRAENRRVEIRAVVTVTELKREG